MRMRDSKNVIKRSKSPNTRILRISTPTESRAHVNGYLKMTYTKIGSGVREISYSGYQRILAVESQS
jgi:hypothetical protein